MPKQRKPRPLDSRTMQLAHLALRFWVEAHENAEYLMGEADGNLTDPTGPAREINSALWAIGHSMALEAKEAIGGTVLLVHGVAATYEQATGKASGPLKPWHPCGAVVHDAGGTDLTLVWVEPGNHPGTNEPDYHADGARVELINLDDLANEQGEDAAEKTLQRPRLARLDLAAVAS